MVTNKLLNRNEETVEVLDFRNQRIVDLFKDYPVDHALLKLKENNAEDNFLGISKPFKLITIPGQNEIDYLVKGNFSKQNRPKRGPQGTPLSKLQGQTGDRLVE